MADFYIRSWDPASTYPPNPHEGDVCYTITLDQSWAPVAGVKNDNLLKTEIYTNGEWVEQGGGGGGSDIPLFKVDFKSEAGTPPTIVYSNESCDKTYDELLPVLTENLTMAAVVEFHNLDVDYSYQMGYTLAIDDDDATLIVGLTANGPTISYASDGTITVTDS